MSYLRRKSGVNQKDETVFRCVSAHLHPVCPYSIMHCYYMDAHYDYVGNDSTSGDIAAVFTDYIDGNTVQLSKVCR